MAVTETIHRIRSNRKTRDIPIVIVAESNLGNDASMLYHFITRNPTFKNIHFLCENATKAGFQTNHSSKIKGYDMLAQVMCDFRLFIYKEMFTVNRAPGFNTPLCLQTMLFDQMARLCKYAQKDKKGNYTAYVSCTHDSNGKAIEGNDDLVTILMLMVYNIKRLYNGELPDDVNAIKESRRRIEHHEDDIAYYSNKYPKTYTGPTY